jgi:hypothetical protein
MDLRAVPQAQRLAHAATDIEDPHPSDDAGIPKEPFGERREEAGLTDQPEMFGVSVAKNVSHVRQPVGVPASGRSGKWERGPGQQT